MNCAQPYATHRATSDVARVRGIIFDCDGVLFDSKEVNRKYYNALRFSLDLPPLSESELEYAHMQTVSRALDRIIPENRKKEMHNVRKKLSYKDYIPYLRPMNGLYALLGTLRSLGIRMAVNTNRLDTMEMILDRFDLSRFFFPVITSQKVAFPKPHPEGIHTILRVWQLERDEVRYVGDSKVDEITASRAGVRFWAYGDDGLLAHRHVSDFWYLRNRIRKMYEMQER
jgi:HAD superfamily hydrolase (TIGR01509 family)